jgi:hypothetical protein
VSGLRAKGNLNVGLICTNDGNLLWHRFSGNPSQVRYGMKASVVYENDYFHFGTHVREKATGMVLLQD